MTNRAVRTLLLLAVLVVLAVTLLPLSGYRGHAHWERVGWVPFADDRSKPWEMAANVLLFLPMGWLTVRAVGATRAGAVAAVLGAGALSVGVELAQVFAHGRIASATDVVLNLAGAALGAAIALRTAAGQRPVGVDGMVSSRSSSQR